MLAEAWIALAVCLVASGCSSLPMRDSDGHPLRHVDGLEALHSLRGGNFALMPGLKWVDVTSVLAGRVHAKPSRSKRLLETEVMAGSRRIEWVVSAPVDYGLPEDIWKRRLDFATQYLAGLHALDGKGLVLELELMPEGVGIDATQRSFYFSRPKLHFYLPLSNARASHGEPASAVAALSTVIHELVHFKLLHTVEADMFDEEVAASTAELCFFLEGMLHEEEVAAVRLPASILLPDRDIDGIVERYGSSVAGTVLARRRLLEEKVQGGWLRLSRDDLPWLQGRCIVTLEKAPR